MITYFCDLRKICNAYYEKSISACGKGESPEHKNRDGDFTKVKVGRRLLLMFFSFSFTYIFQKGATMNKGKTLRKLKEGIQTVSALMFSIGVKTAIVSFAVNFVMSDVNGGTRK